MTRFLLAALAALALSPLTSAQEPPAAMLPPEPPAAMVATAEKLVDPADAVVSVCVAQYGGSAVCLAADNGYTLIATNAHIVAEAPGAAVTVVKDGKTYRCSQPIPCGSEDLVLLVAAGTLPVLEMADEEPKVGEAVALYGYPWDGQGRVVKKEGKVLPDFGGEFSSTLAPVSGDSGGAVVNKDGKLVAINHGFLSPNNQRGAQLGVRLKAVRSHVREKLSRAFPRLGAKSAKPAPAPPGKKSGEVFPRVTWGQKCDQCGDACKCKPGACPLQCPVAQPPKASVPAPQIEYRQVQYYDRRGNLVTQIIPVASRAPSCPNGNCPNVVPAFGAPWPFK